MSYIWLHVLKLVYPSEINYCKGVQLLLYIVYRQANNIMTWLIIYKWVVLVCNIQNDKILIINVTSQNQSLVRNELGHYFISLTIFHCMHLAVIGCQHDFLSPRWNLWSDERVCVVHYLSSAALEMAPIPVTIYCANARPAYEGCSNRAKRALQQLLLPGL